MAYLKLYRDKLHANNHALLKHVRRGRTSNGAWSPNCSAAIGRYLQELVDLGIKEMHDTRISNLKAIKAIAPDVQTVYIKPPAKRSWENVVQVRRCELQYRTVHHSRSERRSGEAGPHTQGDHHGGDGRPARRRAGRRT